ncbi:MAG: M4 family metallopeptidase [Cytophagaceae bacterium]
MNKLYSLSFFLFLLLQLSGYSQSNNLLASKTKAGNGVRPNISSTYISNSNSKEALLTKEIIPDASYEKFTLNHSRLPKIIYDTKSNTPRYIANPSSTNPNQLRSIHFETIPDITNFSLNQIATLFHQSSSSFSNQWKIKEINNDPLGGIQVKLQQHHEDIIIDGYESILKIGKNKEVQYWLGRYTNSNSFSAFTIDETAAIQSALQSIHLDSAPTQDLILKSLQLNTIEVTKIYYTSNSLIDETIPCFKVDIRENGISWKSIYISGINGQTLNIQNNICHVDGPASGSGVDLNGVNQSIQTYLKGSTYYLVDISKSMYTSTGSTLPDSPLGAIITYDLQNTYGTNTSYSQITSTSTSWNNPKAISAHFNASKAFDYYYLKHGRNSINNQGGNIISFINVADPSSGTSMDNAYWNGRAIFYGNGNTAFKPLSGGLDVAGHELSHGVIQNSANLRYSGESGAINESMADIFGCSIDSLDWLIGEDVVNASAFPSGALRSMSDPHNGGNSFSDASYQPKKVSEQYTGTGDNGGVHINSGIPNYAFYLIATSTSRGHAEKIFYRALTQYLTRSSDFIDLRIACVQSATDLFSGNTTIIDAVNSAFDTVEIFIPIGGGGTNNPAINDIPVNSGNEYMVFINTVKTTSYPGSIYRFNQAGPNYFSSLSTTNVFNKVSLSDNGSVASFVNTSNNIVTINAFPGASVNQQTITNDGYWSFVAVSPDGSKIAATSTERDSAIFVLDLASSSWYKFHLYNPTFSEGVKGGGPIYADALEWDYTGQYLVYDCFNVFESTSGGEFSYWDVNFINVWDNSTNQPTSGEITKLFASLPEGVSIGNPTYAKNSSKIIAFDLLDDLNNELYVVACNIEENKMAYVTPDLLTSAFATFGRPNYNKNDDLIAFSYSDSDGEFIVTIDMDVDKINSIDPNDINLLLQESKWGVFFANGTRNLPTSVLNSVAHTSPLLVYPNPSSDNSTLQYTSEWNEDAILKIISSTGQAILTQSIHINTGENNTNIPISNFPKGAYFVIIESKTKKWTGKLIKT